LERSRREKESSRRDVASRDGSTYMSWGMTRPTLIIVTIVAYVSGDVIQR
jgi:hypothetical protein